MVDVYTIDHGHFRSWWASAAPVGPMGVHPGPMGVDPGTLWLPGRVGRNVDISASPFSALVGG